MIRLRLSPLTRLGLSASGGTSPLAPETIAYFAVCTGVISDDVKYAINNLVLKLKADNNWQYIDHLPLLNMPNEQNAMVNLKNPSDPLMVNYNGCVHTPYIGIQGNGTTSYIDTNYNPSTYGGNYTQNDASASMGIINDVNESKIDMGVEDFGGSRKTYLLSRFSGSFYFSLNSSSDILATSSPTSIGNFFVKRTSAPTLDFYKDGSSVALGVNSVSSLVPTLKFYLFAGNQSNVATLPSSKQGTYSLIGGGQINPSTFNAAITEFVNDMEALRFAQYDSDAANYFEHLEGAVSEDVYGLVNNLVTTLKADNNWQYIDHLPLLNMPNEQNAMVNLKSPSDPLMVNYNSCVHTPYIGIQGNGTASFIDLGAATRSGFSFINKTGKFTISMWVNSTNFVPSMGVFTSNSSGNEWGFIQLLDKKVRSYIKGASFSENLSVAVLQDNTWQMVTIVGDGTNQTLYYNGLQSGAPVALNIGGGDATYNTWLGGFEDSGAFKYNGLIDLVGFWNRPLTPEEITILYNNGNGALKSNK